MLKPILSQNCNQIALCRLVKFIQEMQLLKLFKSEFKFVYYLFSLLTP